MNTKGANKCSEDPCTIPEGRGRIRSEERRSCYDSRRDGSGKDCSGKASNRCQAIGCVGHLDFIPFMHYLTPCIQECYTSMSVAAFVDVSPDTEYDSLLYVWLYPSSDTGKRCIR